MSEETKVVEPQNQQEEKAPEVEKAKEMVLEERAPGLQAYKWTSLVKMFHSD